MKLLGPTAKSFSGFSIQQTSGDGTKNQTFIQETLLLGFLVPHSFKIPFFLLVLILYSVTLAANLTIISLVSSSPSLHTPMYFFLSHLSLSDILLITDIVPIFLHGILNGGAEIGITSCLTQFLFQGLATTLQCLILAVMSYDRYMAICKPFHYISVMCGNLQFYLVISCWILSFTLSLVIFNMVRQLQFCSSTKINHFFCELAPLLQLSCSDTSLVELVDIVMAVPLSLFAVLFIIITYICIFRAILRIPTTTGRHKAFSTCSSHLSIVTIFFGTLVAVYIVPSKENSLESKKVLSLLYIVVTPLFNPLIYSLRNHEVRVAFQKRLQCVMGKMAKADAKENCHQNERSDRRSQSLHL